MEGGLDALVRDFADGLRLVDATAPVWTTSSGRSFQPGIGPLPESFAVEQTVQALATDGRDPWSNAQLSVPYPSAPRQRCDLVVGDWAVEIKLLRFLGDNGKPNDNMLMHVLSPYASDRSALTDCDKLAASGFQEQKAVLIYGFDNDGWPLDPAIEAFELLARSRRSIGPRVEAPIPDLMHPVHNTGRVFAWEVLGTD